MDKLLLRSGSVGFWRTVSAIMHECTSLWQIVMPKCWQQHIGEPFFDHAKTRKDWQFPAGSPVFLPSATWHWNLEWCFHAAFKESSTISTPMFTSCQNKSNIYTVLLASRIMSLTFTQTTSTTTSFLLFNRAFRQPNRNMQQRKLAWP